MGDTRAGGLVYLCGARLGGLIVAVFAISRVGMVRKTWLYAWLWYLFVQVISRLITPADLNVNLAYRIQPGWENLFGAYWKFWLVLTLLIALGLWLLALLVERVFPVVGDKRNLSTMTG